MTRKQTPLRDFLLQFVAAQRLNKKHIHTKQSINAQEPVLTNPNIIF